LIAVGSHGQGATLRRVLLGSTAEAVVHRAEASVLVARDPLGDGPVIAACELRREPPAIVEAAAAIAGCYGAELEAVHAVEISLGDLALALSAFFGGQFPPGLDPEGREDLDELIRAALGTQLDLAGASGRAVVLHGSPRSELVHYAQRTNARLVVVGRGSHPRLVKLAIGSVADAVVRSSGRSVLVVKG
jgi:nucleotide-binding universal stress UspA family protein